MTILKDHFSKSLGLPPDAVDWLIQLYQVTQFFDDVADGGEVQRSDLNAALWNVLVSMPRNPFFQTHASDLTPMVAAQILKWQASDRAERKGAADEKSYMWRAGYYEIVLLVVALAHGHEAATNAADAILRIYGEKFDDYMKEFDHA